MLLWVTTFSFFLQLWQVKLCSISLLALHKNGLTSLLGLQVHMGRCDSLSHFHMLLCTLVGFNQPGWMKVLVEAFGFYQLFFPIERHFFITVLATENASKLWQSLTWWQISQGRVNARNTADVAKCEACMPS